MALLVVLVHAGAWAPPCPQLPRPTAARHGAHSPTEVALRAPRPCGCDELPATASGAGQSPLGFALRLLASELPRLPGAPRVAREPRPAPIASIEAPEHVPIPA